MAVAIQYAMGMELSTAGDSVSRGSANGSTSATGCKIAWSNQSRHVWPLRVGRHNVHDQRASEGSELVDCGQPAWPACPCGRWVGRWQSRRRSRAARAGRKHKVLQQARSLRLSHHRLLRCFHCDAGSADTGRRPGTPAQTAASRSTWSPSPVGRRLKLRDAGSCASRRLAVSRLL
jgi:hypothetical protein